MRALVFGGSGQIGRAVAIRLAQAGWQVTATTRGGRALPDDLVALGVARAETGPKAALIARGWDAVMDPLAYTAADAGELIAARADMGRLCVISTASVYADAQGRGFETGPDLGFPEYPFEIAENQPRVPPGPGYSAQKVEMEDALYAADLPLILLRPAAIHGVGARHPREWGVVKRLLDGMQLAVLGEAFDGGDLLAFAAEGRDQAGVERFAVQPHRAGAAVAGVATLLDAEHFQVAQEGAQALAGTRLGRVQAAIDLVLSHDSSARICSAR